MDTRSSPGGPARRAFAGRNPLDDRIEGAVAVASVAVTGSWIALGGAVALGYVLVRSAHTRLRSLWKTEWAAVGPDWRTLA
ncbi:hypothetical protein B0I31_102320 [Saccharothrix carnea]|uniref:Uncharacterized protein n=1 Tax=Saccharothrix carnea TaxID=1280637 RepID=A0A2P8IFV4_SACCR|nr:hypothetical protein [Saccharothrix carnea]PSL57342.1 hypothetical protein B0I31_102320 [Saccharothrix carnea]